MVRRRLDRAGYPPAVRRRPAHPGLDAHSRADVPGRNAAAPGLRPLPEGLALEERELALLLDAEPIHPDDLALRFQRPIGEVLGLLCGLEIAGVVEQAPGRVFRRI